MSATNSRRASRPVWGESETAAAESLIELALAEDFGDRGDVTSEMFLDSEQEGHVCLAVRQEGVIAGLSLLPLIFGRLSREIDCQFEARDGDHVTTGQGLVIISGPAQKILMAERTVLNFLSHLSGVASLTWQYVAEVEGTRAEILDTRKTLPGYRLLDKYAVRCGGGQNHRMGLYDAVMLKDNHLASLAPQSPEVTIQEIRRKYEGISVVVEVDNLQQLEQVFEWEPDVVLLDNMPLKEMHEAVAMRDQIGNEPLLEASGGITLRNVAKIAETGVDRISIGAITHSAPALDLGFDWIDD